MSDTQENLPYFVLSLALACYDFVSCPAIKTHSPHKPVLIFVSSRRQTRLTALDLIAFLAAEDNPKQWLHMPEEDVSTWLCGFHTFLIFYLFYFNCCVAWRLNNFSLTMNLQSFADHAVVNLLKKKRH